MARGIAGREPHQYQGAFPLEGCLPTRGPGPSFDVSLLALANVRGLGRAGVRALADAFPGDLSAVWNCSHEQLANLLASARIPASGRISQEVLEQRSRLIEEGSKQRLELAERSISVVSRCDLPLRLRDRADGPRWLFVEGSVEALHRHPFVAVVGTREPTPLGLRATRFVTHLLAAYPITVVSGLAEGIDAEAHYSSLLLGVMNIAFLGHGVNLVFPASTADLRARIVSQGGAVVTEYLPDEHYRKTYFVERNRLQAAQADLVIPVEGRSKGGTTHTVRFASKYERKIIGIEWDGADGILEQVQALGSATIDVFSRAGQRELDSVFRSLADAAGCPTYAFSLAEDRLRAEADIRQPRPEDFVRLEAVLGKLRGTTGDETGVI